MNIDINKIVDYYTDIQTCPYFNQLRRARNLIDLQCPTLYIFMRDVLEYSIEEVREYSGLIAMIFGIYTQIRSTTVDRTFAYTLGRASLDNPMLEKRLLRLVRLHNVDEYYVLLTTIVKMVDAKGIDLRSLTTFMVGYYRERILNNRPAIAYEDYSIMFLSEFYETRGNK